MRSAEGCCCWCCCCAALARLGTGALLVADTRDISTLLVPSRRLVLRSPAAEATRCTRLLYHQDYLASLTIMNGDRPQKKSAMIV